MNEWFDKTWLLTLPLDEYVTETASLNSCLKSVENEDIWLFILIFSNACLKTECVNFYCNINLIVHHLFSLLFNKLNSVICGASLFQIQMSADDVRDKQQQQQQQHKQPLDLWPVTNQSSTSPLSALICNFKKGRSL